MNKMMVLSAVLLATATTFAALPFRNGDKIAFLGDSITQFGTDEPDGWVNLVERAIRAESPEVAFIHAGIAGNMSCHMASRLDKDVLRRKPTWMFFSCGVNDTPNGLEGASCNPGRSVEKYRASLEEIFDKCDRQGVKVIVLSQTPVLETPVDHPANRNLVAYNAALKEIALARKYVYLDPGAAIRDEIGRKADKGCRTLTVDGTHLNGRGNAIYAETVLKGLGAVVPKKEAVVFVAAHPDDLAEPLGTALLMRGKFDIHVFGFTRGERGLGEAGCRDGSTAKRRTAEEERVTAAIGAKDHWLGEIDGDAYANREVCARAAALLKELKPRAIFAHWPLDVHNDHVMSTAMILKAIQLAGIPRPEIYFHPQSHQTRNMAATFLVDVTSVFAEKQALIKYWECQNVRKLVPAQSWGRRMTESDDRMAEAFAPFREIRQGERTIFDELPKTELWP